jgi:DNA polymerase-3 subunit alpha
LDDGSGVIEARADEALINAHKDLLKEDELIIAMGKQQPDRFSGGMQLTITQLWNLEQARCRFGKYLRVTTCTDSHGQPLDVARLVKAHPAKKELTEQGDLWRGLGVRLLLECGADSGRAKAELQLDERAKFYPSNAALASWWAQATPGTAEIIYE